MGKPRAAATRLLTRSAKCLQRLLCKASQALSLAGPWQALRGYLGQAPSKHNGLLHEVWPVVRKLSSCPHRCAALAPFGFTQPPLCLAPLRSCTRHQRCSCRAPYQSMCRPWLRHRHKTSKSGAYAQSLKVDPPPDRASQPLRDRAAGASLLARSVCQSCPSAPKGLPFKTKRGLDAGQAVKVGSPRN